MLANLLTASRIALLAPLAILLSAPSGPARWGAFAILLLAGLTDILDGRIARALGQTSRLGAMLDLLADRLLTLTVVLVLVQGRELAGLFAAAGWVLVARDLAVAGFGEASGGGLQLDRIEKAKVALQFTGLALLTAPGVFALQHRLGAWFLVGAALLAAGTVVAYAKLARRRLAHDRAA